MSTQDIVVKNVDLKLVKKTFSRLGKLLVALSDDMPNPLPAAAVVEEVSIPLLQTISQKLAHTITKYVLVVCQEGTLSVIETHTGYLLEELRRMCTALRSLYPVAGVSMRAKLIEVGQRVLREIKSLTEDVYNQLELQHAALFTEDASRVNDLDNNKALTKIIARLWGTCDQISKIPLNNWEAVAMNIVPVAGSIEDAAFELGDIIASDEIYPEEEVEVNHVTDALDDMALGGLDDDEEDEDEDAELNEDDLLGDDDDVDQELVDDEMEDEDYDDEDDDLDFIEKDLSQLEYRWVPPATSIISIAGEVVRKAGELLQTMKAPENSAYTLPRAALLSDDVSLVETNTEVISKYREQVKLFDAECEQLHKDVDVIADHTDRLGNSLYSPQSIVNAARSTYVIVTRTSKVISWIERRDKEGWFNAIHAAEKAAAKRIKSKKSKYAVEEKSTKGKFTKKVSAEQQMKIFTGERANTPEVQQLHTAYKLAETDNTTPYYADSIVTIGATAKSTSSANTWTWLNDARTRLQGAYQSSPSLYLMYVKVFKSGEVLNDDSDNEADDEEEDPDQRYVNSDHEDYDIDNDDAIIIY